MMRKTLAILLSCLACNTVSANLWQDTSATELRQLRGASSFQAQQNQVFRFDEARLLNLNMATLNHYLDSALPEGSAGSTVSIQLPLPHGEFVDYLLYHSPVMAAGLAAKYPEIRTFKVIQANNPANTGHLDLTPQGFHAMLQHDEQTVFIDPLGTANHYQSYFKHDYVAKKVNSAGHKPFVCSSNHFMEEQPLANPLTRTQRIPASAARLSSGAQIKTYRLAIAATSEFTRFHGGTKELGLAALVTGISRINKVYGRDLAVRLEIVEDNDKIIYTDPLNDPFNSDIALSSQAVTTIKQEIGTTNYDVGHVVSGKGDGGLAGISVICNDDRKAFGETSRDSPINDPFFIDYVAHELGHQFGSQHSFNATSDSCGGFNRFNSHAYEPGGGSTIMGYAGICGAENLQQNSDAYFHSDSIEQIRNHLDNGSGNTCGVTSGNNKVPTVIAGDDKAIPKQTPFTLNGSGSDADGDTLTYTWEQLDLGPATNSRASLVDNGQGPIFRSFTPTKSPSRTFPQLSDILNNITTYGETLPTTERDLNFSLTVRDGKGGVASDELKLEVVAAAGPFKVTLPANTNWGNEKQTITWDVANTTVAPVSCAMVKIDLSADGGASFPMILAASTANTGSATVTIPAVSTTNGRVRVSCTTQPFFAINTAKITITSDGSGGNEAPVAMNDNFTLDQAGNARKLDVLRNDSDPDGDSLTITELNSNGNHTIKIANDNKSINLKHSAGFSGVINFTYTVSDGTAQSSANVSVTITAPPNETPVAKGDAYEVKQNSSETIFTALDNDTDADGDILTIFRINSISNGGTVTIAADGKSISYKPSDNFKGTEIINYAIRDENGATASANIRVTVVKKGGGGSNSPYFLMVLLMLAIWQVARATRLAKLSLVFRPKAHSAKTP